MAVPTIFNPQQAPTYRPQAQPQSQPPDPSVFGSGLDASLANFNGKDNPYTGFLDDRGGRSPANIAAIRLAPAEYWNLAQQYGFHNSLTDTEHQAVQSYLNQLMHPDLMSNEYRQQQLGAITGEAAGLQNSLAQAGAGQGAKEGAALSLFNNANRNANTFDANLYGPSGRTAIAKDIAGTVEGTAPNWQNEGAIASITNGTPRSASGLQAAGSIIGGLAGGGAFGNGGIFGK